MTNVIEYNPIAKSKALRKAMAKTTRIKELNLSTEMSQEDKDAVIINLATAKAMVTGKKLKDVVGGQTWYVEDLIEYSCLTPKERFEKEYNDCLIDEADEDDIEAFIESCM